MIRIDKKGDRKRTDKEEKKPTRADKSGLKPVYFFFKSLIASQIERAERIAIPALKTEVGRYKTAKIPNIANTNPVAILKGKSFM